MATQDEILGTGTQQPLGPQNKHQNPTAQPVAGSDTSSSSASTSQSKSTTTVVQQQPQPTEQPSMSYVDMFKKLYGEYTPPTPEELEKERKRQKANKIIAAVGDGISAMANLVATSHGAPNAYTGTNTLTGALKVRYDKLKADRDKDRDAYFKNWLSAAQADDAANRWKQGHDFQKEQFKWRKDTDERDFNYRKKKDEDAAQAAAAAAQAAAAAAQYQQQRDQKSDEQKAAELAYKERDSKRRAAAQKAAARAKSRQQYEKAMRGNQLIFKDADGKDFPIWQNVWEPAAEMIYEFIKQDILANPLAHPGITPNDMIQKTPAAKESFARQYWTLSPTAVTHMQRLAQTDPAVRYVDEDTDTTIPGLSGDDNTMPGVKQ